MGGVTFVNTPLSDMSLHLSLAVSFHLVLAGLSTAPGLGVCTHRA